MKKLTMFVYAVLAGLAISIGGIVFLTLESKLAGAIFFSVGLFMVLVFGLNLFTGKVCYLFDNPPKYILDLVIILFGNLAGSVIAGLAVRSSRISTICERAANVCGVKLGDDLWSIFVLAIFCDIMIYVAVDNYKNNPHDFGKYLGVLLAIPVFILCGFEHCVANMFYITAAGAWDSGAVVSMIVMVLGNTVGGVIFPLCKKLKAKAGL